MKRVILLTIALNLSLLACGQVFRMEMDVLEGPDNLCFSQVSVTWGVKGDTMAFRYNQRLIVLERIVPNTAQMDQLHAIQSGNIGSFVLAKAESRLYLVRLVESAHGMVIFINNLEDRKEYYLFDFTDLDLCNTKTKNP